MHRKHYVHLTVEVNICFVWGSFSFKLRMILENPTSWCCKYNGTSIIRISWSNEPKSCLPTYNALRGMSDNTRFYTFCQKTINSSALENISSTKQLNFFDLYCHCFIRGGVNLFTQTHHKTFLMCQSLKVCSIGFCNLSSGNSRSSIHRLATCTERITLTRHYQPNIPNHWRRVRFGICSK